MDTSAYVFVALLFGGAVGAGFSWLLLRNRATASRAAEFATLNERLSAREQDAKRLESELENERAELKNAREQNATARAELEGERRAARERSENFRKVTEELSEKFKALSRDALRDNNQSFLVLARTTLERFQETAKGDLESRQKAIDQLVKPLKESLEKVDGKIGEIEKARAGAYAELREQVKALVNTQGQLQAETGNLVKALRTPHIRGRWGEIQLRRVVELAGMLEYCDFCEQESFSTEDGRIRPDLIVRLPGNRTIVVDAKVPFDAFYESVSTTDDDVRGAKLKEHARLVRMHISLLSRKSYWESLEPTPEFVLLFLPGETFYSAALENDPKLIEDGVAQRVIIATPTTLIALLKAVSYGWRQEQMATNAQEVSKLAKELYDRLRKFTNHFANIGKGLGRAIEAYNQGVGSLEARVLFTANKFKELGAIPGNEIETPESIDKTERALALDNGGLFPEIVAADAGEDEDEPGSLFEGQGVAAGQ